MRALGRGQASAEPGREDRALHERALRGRDVSETRVVSALVHDHARQRAGLEGLDGDVHPQVGIIIAVPGTGRAGRAADRRRRRAVAPGQTVHQETAGSGQAGHCEHRLIRGAVDHVEPVAGRAEGLDGNGVRQLRATDVVGRAAAALEQAVAAIDRFGDHVRPVGEVLAFFDVDQIDVDEPREVVEIDLRLGERGRRRQQDEEEERRREDLAGAGTHRAHGCVAPGLSSRRARRSRWRSRARSRCSRIAPSRARRAARSRAASASG